MAGTGNFVRKTVSGDEFPREVCTDCGYIAYENPKVVVGSVVEDELGRILLCRRAIEPRTGFWTLPAGYLELEETPQEGAAREAWEEACARVELRDLLAVYSLVHLSQVQLFYRGALASPDVAAGPESLEVRLFHWDEIPWDELAFPSVHWALRDFERVRGEKVFRVGGNPAESLGAGKLAR